MTILQQHKWSDGEEIINGTAMDHERCKLILREPSSMCGNGPHIRESWLPHSSSTQSGAFRGVLEEAKLTVSLAFSGPSSVMSR